MNRTTYRSDQVLGSEGIWAVFHDGTPINLRTLNSLTSHPGPKYKKVSFSNAGHAINLCKKLNFLFNTNKFEVILLRHGDTVFTQR